MSAISGLRASLHSSRIPGRARSYASSSKNTILYGWGRKSALPLSSVVDDAVFMVPTLLNDQPNYVLKVRLPFVIVVMFPVTDAVTDRSIK